MGTQQVEAIDVAPEVSDGVPASMIEEIELATQAEAATCTICGTPVRRLAGETASLLVEIGEQEFGFGVAHRACSPSRAVDPGGLRNPFDRQSAWRFCLHLRSRNPSAVLIWDHLVPATHPHVGLVVAILWSLGFDQVAASVSETAPRTCRGLRATFSGDELRLLATGPEMPEEELVRFPAGNHGPWIAAASTDEAITLICGRLDIGPDHSIDRADRAILSGAGAIAGTIQFCASRR